MRDETDLPTVTSDRSSGVLDAAEHQALPEDPPGQSGELLVLVDSGEDARQSQIHGKSGQRTDDFRVDAVVRQPFNERSIDLDRVDGQDREVARGRRCRCRNR